jgi:hypothetical protein
MAQAPTPTIGELASARCSECAAARAAGYENVSGWQTGPDGELHNHLEPSNNFRGGTIMAKSIGISKYVANVRDTTLTESERQAARDLARNFPSTPKAHVATFESVAKANCSTCADSISTPGAIWQIGPDGLPHIHPAGGVTFTYQEGQK